VGCGKVGVSGLDDRVIAGLDPAAHAAGLIAIEFVCILDAMTFSTKHDYHGHLGIH